ncbi:Uncharacterised protein [Vibrio cholerae]|nr:Uncharacterised protein [Vibrio cholerae]
MLLTTGCHRIRTLARYRYGYFHDRTSPPY